MSQKSEEKMYELLTKFANDHTLAKEIDVIVSPHHTSLTAKDNTGARFEDANFLSSLITGATSFLWWCERHGYKVVKSAKRS